MAAKTIKFKIVNGPSSPALCDALQYAFNKATPHLATFRSSNGSIVTVQITGLAHESGNDDSWNFAGNAKAEPSQGSTVSGTVKGYYNARTRTGTIELTMGN